MAPYLELKPIKQSVAKAAEKQSGQLTDNQKFTVEEKPFLITDYEPGQAGHYKVTLFGAPHPDLGDECYLWPEHYEEFPQLLKVLQNTVLKKDPKKQASQLTESQLKDAQKGQLIVISGAGEVVNKCVAVTLVTDDGKEEEWWAYLNHCETIGTSQSNRPKEEKPATNPEQRKKQKAWYTTAVPGISKLNMYDPISRTDAPNLYWYEALHFNGKSFRCPKSINEVHGIIAVAKEVQKIRNHYNRPITINSFFRPDPWNARANGARLSQHKKGNAVDYNVSGLSPHQVRRYIESTGFVGGLASSSVFVHQDTRPWNSRWSYGF